MHYGIMESWEEIHTDNKYIHFFLSWSEIAEIYIESAHIPPLKSPWMEGGCVCWRRSLPQAGRRILTESPVFLTRRVNDPHVSAQLQCPLHPKAAGHTFFSSAHGTSSKADRMFGHKISLKKFKVEIISNIFWDHYSIKLEINYKKKAAKKTNMWRLNYTLLNNPWVKEEIKEEVTKYLGTSENRNTSVQNLWDTEKQS